MNIKTLLLAGAAATLLHAATAQAQPAAARHPLNSARPTTTQERVQTFREQLQEKVFGKSMPKSTAKTTATGSRVIAYAYRYFDGAAYLLSDTAELGYTGDRGGTPSDDFPKCDFIHSMSYNDSVGALVNSDSVTQTFDAANNVTGRTYKSWNIAAGIYEYSNQSFYTYTAAKKMATQLNKNWDGSSFVNSDQTIYTYDASGNETEQAIQFWDGSAWQDMLKMSTTYSASNKPLTATVTLWTGSSWDVYQVVKYTYDASDLVATDTTQALDISSMTLAYDGLNQYTHDAAGNLTIEDGLYWDGVSWNKNKRMINEYDAAKNNINTITGYWDMTSGAYDTSYREVKAYNSFNYLQSTTSQTWVPATKTWETRTGDYNEIYYYESYTTSVKETTVKGGKASVYPVPATNELHIDVQWTNPQALSVVLTDLNGRQLMSRNRTTGSSFNETINLQGLPSGNYFLQLQGDKGGQIVQQVVIAH